MHLFYNGTPNFVWREWNDFNALKGLLCSSDCTLDCIIYNPFEAQLDIRYFSFKEMKWFSRDSNKSPLEPYEISHWSSPPQNPQEWRLIADAYVDKCTLWKVEERLRVKEFEILKKEHKRG